MKWFKVKNVHTTNVGIGGQNVRPGEHKVLTEEKIDEGLKRLETRGFVSIESSKKPSARVGKDKAKKKAKGDKKSVIVAPDAKTPAKDYKEEVKAITPENTPKANTVDKIIQGEDGRPAATVKAGEDTTVIENPNYDAKASSEDSKGDTTTEESSNDEKSDDSSKEPAKELSEVEKATAELEAMSNKEIKAICEEYGVKPSRAKADSIKDIIARKLKLEEITE